MCKEKNEEPRTDIMFLDAYFSSRSPRPLEGFIEDDKTTKEIMDELEDMKDIAQPTINRYMLNRGYNCKQREDGSISWRIFRSL